MESVKYPHLLAPTAVKSVYFTSRILAGPVSASCLTDGGKMTDRGIWEYEIRARGGFAGVTVPGGWVDDTVPETGLRVRTAQLTPSGVESFSLLAESIRSHGAIAAMELSTAECRSVDDLTPEELERMADQFAEAAENCRRMGFQMAVLQGGHGWFLHRMLSPLCNHRTDEYGGSLENRARLSLQICEKIRQRCGKGILIEYQIPSANGTDCDLSQEECATFAELIQESADLILVTEGTHQNPSDSGAVLPPWKMPAPVLELAAAVKQAVRIPVAAGGEVQDPAAMEEALASGVCDFISVGRPQLADPELVSRIRAGKEQEIAPCLRCPSCNPWKTMGENGTCAAGEAWSCAVNPRAGREQRYAMMPRPGGKRKVMVVGGGPAGLSAAATAAERGNDVILVETCSRLGGLLWFTEEDRNKELLRQFRDSLIARCRRLGVKFQLGTTADLIYLNRMKPDVLLCAVGSFPMKPQAEGVELAHHVLFCYDKPESVGHSVVIIGGGPAGCETADWLTQAGRQVHILEQREDLLLTAEESYRSVWIPRLRESGVTWDCRAQVTRITEEGVFFQNQSGEETFHAADAVLYAVGQRPNRQLIDEMDPIQSRFFPIGDCAGVGDVKKAVQDGFHAAMDIL